MNQHTDNLFNQSYNQNNWKKFLSETFPNSNLLIQPQILDQIDNNIAKQVLKLGYITLNENDIERQIIIYEVTLAQDIILERNRVGLRNLLRKHWKNIDAAFITYHIPEKPNWRFTYVSELTGYNAEGELIKIETEPKRYTYLFGKDETVKTATERFKNIANKAEKITLDDVKEAFSVEKLSKSFFDEYKKHYETCCKYMIEKPNIYQNIFDGKEKNIRDFNKKLLGRIVFLYFIQKKGWLGVDKNKEWGQGDPKFLSNLFENTPNPKMFYTECLAKLFFDTLNTKRKNDLTELVKNKICKIPYLNGGLFEETNPKQRNISLPENLFKNLFEFFNQYNFTIYEDDPNDHTVAVDPEMLGHIFENLLEDNKDKGAYYTPKEIVHYMCQESLIEYLHTWFENKGYQITTGYSSMGNEPNQQLFPINEGRKGQLMLEANNHKQEKKIDRTLIEKLLKKKLDDNDKELVKQHATEFNQALDKVKICDPAIGSGAFPMGLLHEIFTAKQTLHTFQHGNTKTFEHSNTKLNIIQNSIYGVDIEKGAVDIARLRFWLSLVVDEETPKPLPNLDYKIVVGNSLVSKLDDDIIDINWNLKTGVGKAEEYVQKLKNALTQLTQKQKNYFEAADKNELKIEIRNIKIDILINQLLLNKQRYENSNPIKTVLEFELKTTDIKKNAEIKTQIENFKTTIENLQKIKTKPDATLQYFDWKLDFPEVMNEQITPNVGFDIVIGNPPYLNFKMYSSEDKQLYKKKYPAIFDGKADIYYYFFICAAQLAKQNAFITLITSRYWLEAEFASKLRKYLVDNVTFIEIVDFKNVTVFDGIGIKTGVTSFIKSTSDSYSFYYRDHPGKKIERVNLDEFKSIKVPKTNLDKSNWILKDFEGSLLIHKIEENSFQLSEIANCKQGVVTGLDKAFITTSNEFSALPKKLRKPWLKVGDIHKYKIILVEKRELLYTNEIENLNDYPSLKERLQEFKIKLSNRREAANGKIRWFDLQWARDSKIFSSEKLICRFKASENTFCFDDTGFYSSADTTVVCLKNDNKDYNLKYLLALLNSRLLDYYFKSYGKLMDYRYEYYPGPVGNIRIKKSSNQDKFISLVDKILTLKSEGKNSTSLEQEIDNLVYKLYELTYDEVKVIDPTFSLSEAEYEALKLE